MQYLTLNVYVNNRFNVVFWQEIIKNVWYNIHSIKLLFVNRLKLKRASFQTIW